MTSEEIENLHQAVLVTELKQDGYKGLSLQDAWDRLHIRQTITTQAIRLKPFTIDDVMPLLTDESAVNLVNNPQLDKVLNAIKTNDVATLAHWATFFVRAKVMTADERDKITELASRTEQYDVVTIQDARIGGAFAGVEGMPNEISMDKFIAAFNQLNGGA